MVTIALLALVSSLFATTEAMKNTPFDYEVSGLEITNFELDFKDIEIILDVRVIEPLGTIEISFEREFFDSKFSGIDEDFTILADGELVYYSEIENSFQHRIIKFNIPSGTTTVEIFGTKLMGLEINHDTLSKQVNSQIFQDQSSKSQELSIENKQLKEENEFLKKENERLDGKIFELENLISALEYQVGNLNALVLEQVNVIYKWVLG